MDAPLEVFTGWAADAGGRGVVYARLVRGGAQHVLRADFQTSRLGGLEGREVGYAAVLALCEALHRRRIDRVRLYLEDARLVDDVERYRELPQALAMAYVRLRCSLNRFIAYSLHAFERQELTARARSEVALHTAA